MLEKTLKLLEKIELGIYKPNSEMCFEPTEMIKLAHLLNKLVYAPSNLRSFLQQHGITITPSDYYNEIPTITDIENSFIKGKLLYCESLFDKNLINNFLSHIENFSIEFDPPQTNIEMPEKYYWENGMFGYSDAMAYYCTIRYLKPKRIIEIGAGFSSLIAIDALKKNRTGSLTCIEPYPREFLIRNHEIDLIITKVQDITIEYLNENLSDGDILFIDSTHTVKHGSDCLHIYLNLLPNIKKNIYVHVHDIFLPYSLPLEYLRDKQIYWTEQYILAAYFLDNPKIKLLFSSSYSYQNLKEQLDGLMHNRAPSGGASIWFSLKGNSL